ncbi:DNA-processing protein DprA [Roseibium sp. RKSG952]|uniref:DNA-processing protein DprA n=1 Tax=Roseibium sp. RKSG952 TaxID=2529384 RepID=UPI0018AD267A|nr:DNA-processing protein DprA [Roseibium sp. RKSG952]
MKNLEFGTSEGLLTLLGIKGLGAVTARGIAEKFADLDALRTAEDEEFKGIANVTVRDLLRNDNAALQEANGKARREIEGVKEVGADVVCFLDELYPEQLLHIPDMPLVLRVCGDLGVIRRSIAFVGARAASEFGQTATHRMAQYFASRDWTIVSGLASGIDQISHRAALEVGKPTVAVIGSGIDTYRNDHELDMAVEIAGNGGLVISEQPCGRDADRATLIKRNRLITGLSVATFVMQAARKSGTMHSVRYATHQGKPIYVPGIPGKFQSDPLNEVPRLLAQSNGSDFVRWADFSQKIIDEVDEREEQPLATAIASRDAYLQVEQELEIMMPAAAKSASSLPKVA